jgi:hypothetical protein
MLHHVTCRYYNFFRTRVTLPWRWRSQFLLKCWYLCDRLHSVSSQENVICIFTAIRTSWLFMQCCQFTFLFLHCFYGGRKHLVVSCKQWADHRAPDVRLITMIIVHNMCRMWSILKWAKN